MLLLHSRTVHSSVRGGRQIPFEVIYLIGSNVYRESVVVVVVVEEKTVRKSHSSAKPFGLLSFLPSDCPNITLQRTMTPFEPSPAINSTNTVQFDTKDSKQLCLHRQRSLYYKIIVHIKLP